MAWETGTGTVTAGSPNTLSRTTVYASTNSNAKIVLTSGLHSVFTTAAANHSVHSSDLDNAFGATRGNILFRGSAGWVVLAPGSVGDTLTSGGGGADVAWAGGSKGYSVSFSAPQTTAYITNQVVGHHPFSIAVTIPANFGAYNGRTSQAGGTANTTSTTIVNVQKALAVTPNIFTTIGTITFATGGVAATLATTGGTDQLFAQSDVLRVIMPAAADATFAGFYCNLVGHLT